MSKIYERISNPAEMRKIEILQSELTKQRSLIDYLAKTMNIEMPKEEESEEFNLIGAQKEV